MNIGIAKNTFLNTRCLRNNKICSVTREGEVAIGTRETAIGVAIEDTPRVDLEAKECPPEDKMLKADEVAVKSWHIGLVVGIFVCVLLIIGFIIGYICIKKRKNITPESGKYSLVPNTRGGPNKQEGWAHF